MAARAKRICPVCGGEVRSSKRIYCCETCTHQAHVLRCRQYARDVRAGKRVRTPREPGPKPDDLPEIRPNKGETRRRCLRCDGWFASRGPEHRLCDGCREANRQWIMGGGNEEAMYHVALWDGVPGIR